MYVYSTQMRDYIKVDDIIDYEHEAIKELADQLFLKAETELDFIKIAYEFVRDHIHHSADIQEDEVTCTASQVLQKGHGICFAKSHLLAAILRCKRVPVGFCYQKLLLVDEAEPILIYHGLNAVYSKDSKKWIRLDARGNKEGVNALFSTETEQLAFPIRKQLGEEDECIIYPNPAKYIVESLQSYTSRSELWKHLPTKLGYDKESDF